MVAVITAHYQKEMERLIGQTIFQEILRKIEAS
jgi:hypothetical protein